MFEYSANDFYNHFMKFLFLIKIFFVTARSKAVFGRNDHKQGIVEASRNPLSENCLSGRDLKFRFLIPVCRPTSFSVFRFSTVYNSLRFHSKFHINRFHTNSNVNTMEACSENRRV